MPTSWRNSTGGSISAESQHPAHERVNGVSQRPARHQSAVFNLIWAHSEWTEYLILDNEILEKMSAPHLSISRKTDGVLKLPTPGVSNSRQKIGFENFPDLGNNSPSPNPSKQPLSCFLDINGKMDLEKLIWTPSIPGGDPRLPDAAGAGAGAAGQTLRSQPDPSPNAPRDQIRRKEPCCDIFEFEHDVRKASGGTPNGVAWHTTNVLDAFQQI